MRLIKEAGRDYFVVFFLFFDNPSLRFATSTVNYVTWCRRRHQKGKSNHFVYSHINIVGTHTGLARPGYNICNGFLENGSNDFDEIYRLGVFWVKKSIDHSFNF
mgnify:CR=1 FL=1